MYRYKFGRGSRRDSGSPSKRDTPWKTTLNRRGTFKRLLPIKKYETLPEESVVDDKIEPTGKPNQPLSTGVVGLGHWESALHRSKPSCTEDTWKKATSRAIPAAETTCNHSSQGHHLTMWVTAIQKPFIGGDMMNEEAEQNLSVSPESSTPSRMESDTTFNYDEDQEDSCHFKVSGNSCSVSSPEIFRNENTVETMTFSNREELLGLQLNIKNSTLLDISHAKRIQLHPLPNLSNITGASMILAENNKEIICSTKPEPETKTQTDSLNTDEALKRMPPPKLINRKPILCKKKVGFESPVFSEIFKPKSFPLTRLRVPNTSELIEVSIPRRQIKPDPSKTGVGIKKDTPPLQVTTKRPVNNKAKFFDFIDDNDRNEFFQKMRERYVKLKSYPSFPVTSSKHTTPSALIHQKSK